MTITEGTPLFDYQEFCELLDHIQTLKDLASQYKCDAAMYRKKIEQICERVETDFCDKHHFFANWVDGMKNGKQDLVSTIFKPPVGSTPAMAKRAAAMKKRKR